MDQIIPRVLRFDRFELDLTRGCVRAGLQQIDLAPKPFEVLTHLAENAGRLVSKQELLDAVWPNLSVTDDSLVQCIRELRSKLGDESHRLIKTVARRGYLLDTSITASGSPASLQGFVERESENRGSTMTRAESPSTPRRLTAVVALVATVSFGAYLLMPWSFPVANSKRGPATILYPQPGASELFTRADARRIAEIAEIKQLPLPAFQISKPSSGTNESARRFIGVWVSGPGWLRSNRQFMLIVTDVSPEGVAQGYTVDGPPQPKSSVQDTAIARAINAQILGNTLYFSGRNGDFAASLTAQNRIEFKLKFADGHVGVVGLDPAWTLVAAEKAAAAELVTR